MTGVKMQGKKTIIDGITFDSAFESSLYKGLLTAQKINPNLKIEVQFPILVRPPSRNYPQKNWKVDFIVFHGQDYLLIEGKGQPEKHSEMISNIRSMDIYSPVKHDNLLIVIPNNQWFYRKGEKVKSKLSLQRSVKVPVLHQKEMIKYVLDYFR